jgi:M6 family metalloprotease-like protein
MPSGSLKALSLAVAVTLCGLLGAMVPPHPQYRQVPAGFQPTRVELPAGGFSTLKSSSKPVPNDILVLRVEFADVKFQDTAVYPDGLVHDDAFFDRWMLHLHDFFADASHYTYDLNYTFYPTVFTLPEEMGHYGMDVADTIDVNLDDLTSTLMQMADPLIDFSQYGGLIVFHAGAGQESDINGYSTGEIWSTFLTRKRLQSWFDEDNDTYQGWPADGVHLTNIVLVPESEYQDYFPGEGENNADAYLFSIYGVLAHQFGHILGLPSLFDNDSSNGTSQGIGNWGLMGTGIWNASGYVPAQLDPWCRMYLGWEPAVTVEQSTTGLVVDYFLNPLPSQRLYKIPISDHEYFLVENRQQNPDQSLDPYTSMPSYTFKLLPEGEQDYYENYPLLPFFNFMENRYLGSEWDFMLPGLGGPIPTGMGYPVDGSGLMIWHIDENVIAANFTSNFDQNTVNAYAPHKGVDLEEADGIQNLDTGAPDQYKYGSPYDSFREGNNAYFGLQSFNGALSLPTAESYYGGVPVEIYDIGPSGKQMTFSVRFGWSLTSSYSGENGINACVVDFDGDSETEIVYPMPDGQIYAWKDELPLSGFPLSRQPMEHTYVWTGDEFYFPMQVDDLARLYRLDSDGGQYLFSFSGNTWATHPLSDGESVYFALNDTESSHSGLYRYDPDDTGVNSLREFEYPIVSNMAWFRNHLFIPTRQEGTLFVWETDASGSNIQSRMLDVPPDSTIVGLFMASLLPSNPSSQGELIVQCANSIYAYDANDQILPGFPFVHDMHSTAPLTIADWDRNGSLDLIITSDSGVAVIDYSGSLMSQPSLFLPASDSLAFNAGALVSDIDHDGKNELLGAFGYNRLNCWEHDFRKKNGYPVSFGKPSRNMPLIGSASDGQVYAWLASDNGSIYRQLLPDANLADLDNGWNTEYGSLLRQASRENTGLPNQYETNDLFVPGELYIYPNPLKSIYDNKLTLNVMTSKDTPLEVKIFDINGGLVYVEKSNAKAYLRNRQVIDLPESRLHSGVYIAIVSGDRASRSLKFAVER